MALGASSSLAASPPIPRTRLIGREAERQSAGAWLVDGAVPMLTLTGAGGVGKTRLAIEIARDVAGAFPDGVAWVDLSTVTDAALTANAAAAALGAMLTPDRPAQQTVVDHLRGLQVLLLLDNCEHLLPTTVELVAEILARCPAVQVLATSRARLRVRGEHVLPVEPLPLPDDEMQGLATVETSDAVRMFGERAHAADPTFALSECNAAAVAALCRHVEGLPLAIELTAARVAVLPPEALLSRMSSRLPLLRDGPRDVPPRQQTMRDTIAWSYDLLDPAAQALFRRLSVFVGGFTLEAASAIWPPGVGRIGEPESDALTPFGLLVEHHLVRRDPASDDAEPRYRMLETVREFGLEQLAEAGEEAEARTRHARYFWTLTDTLNAKVAPHLPEAPAVFDRLNREHPNLRAALGWFVAAGMAEEAVSLAGWLHAFWLHVGNTREGRQWLERTLDLGGTVSAPARVWALVGLAALLSTPHNARHKQSLIEEAVTLARAADDPICIAVAVQWQGLIDANAGRFDRAEWMLHHARETFSRVPQSPWIARDIAHLEAVMGWIALIRGDFATAETRYRTALERQRVLEREHQAPYPYVCNCQIALGYLARARGEFGPAFGHYQGALRDNEVFREVRNEVAALCGIAGALAANGRWPEAARLFGAAERLCEESHIPFDEHGFNWQRALGLPEPWQRAGDGFGAAATLAAAIQARSAEASPPLADPAAAARHWADGRGLSRGEAVTEALAVEPMRLGVLPRRQLTAPAPPRDAFGLSPREREVLALLCQRFSDAEIGEALYISPRTASSHVAHIYDKLGVGSRREAAALAARHGLAWRRAGDAAEPAP